MKKNVYIVFAFLLFTSCSSIPKVKGNGKLCGFVTDNNNCPVAEAIIGARKKGGMWKYVLTNANGMFVFDNETFGEYEISAKKNYFVEYIQKDVNFCERNKIFCIQLQTINDACDEIEENILCEEYDSALNLIEKIVVGKRSPIHKLLDEYKSIIKEAHYEE